MADEEKREAFDLCVQAVREGFMAYAVKAAAERLERLERVAEAARDSAEKSPTSARRASLRAALAELNPDDATLVYRAHYAQQAAAARAELAAIEALRAALAALGNPLLASPAPALPGALDPVEAARAAAYADAGDAVERYVQKQAHSKHTAYEAANMILSEIRSRARSAKSADTKGGR